MNGFLGSLQLVAVIFFRLLPCHAFVYPAVELHPHTKFHLYQSEGAPVGAEISASGIYFDVEVAGEPIGRLDFELTNPSPLPLHTENLIQLCRGGRRGIDPLAHYTGCEFDFSPMYVEDGSGRYRWAHICKGRGRNAIGRPDEPIVDSENMLKHTHSCYGGQYYGDIYNGDYSEFGVVLTVPVVGPGRGGSRFSILRVGESPPEWQERLLLNSAVVGKLVSEESMETLCRMARQRAGPPTIFFAGTVD